MKNSLMTAILSLFFLAGISQNPRTMAPGVTSPALTKEALAEATSIHGIMSLTYPVAVNYLALWRQTIDYVSVEVQSTCEGKTLTSASTGEMLTTEQRNILMTSDIGCQLNIHIRYKDKDASTGDIAADGKMHQMTLAISVLPDREAQYPGGFLKMTEYLKQNVLGRLPVSEDQNSEAAAKINQAVMKFTVNEEGRVIDATIHKSTSDPAIDQLLIEATHQMPRWKPAESARGEKVKRPFTIAVGMRGTGC